MTTEAIQPPRSARASLSKRGPNWEKWGWLYMRASGVLLVVLIFGHLLVNLFLGEGVSAIDFAFVAGKLADPFWIVWDLLLLWLALIHGANGMRTIVNDYAHGRLRSVLLGALLVSTIGLLILGTLVLTTFDPCIGDPQNGELAALCAAR
jgi:succinate dehydrogenase / fumarate reductase, membrane anchor subunit